ncbi:MAG: hypothetical protein ABIJ96_04845 [Elusimicrobiota bacterium]
MKQIIAAALVLAICLGPAQALETPEAISVENSLGFQTAVPNLKRFKFAGSQYVHLSGNLSLRGNEYLHQETGYVSVTLSGSTSLFGSGGVSAGNVRINERVSIYLREGSNYISESVQVSEYVSVYKNGRYVGSTHVTGTIRVSGWLSGKWLRLDGSGTISGSLFVQDDKNKG